MPHIPSLRLLAGFPTLALVLSACSAPKPPADADIAAYLARQDTDVLKYGAVTSAASPAQAPAGAWMVTVHYAATAQKGLYRLAPGAEAMRVAFDRAVIGAEAFRLDRIAAVEGFARNLGLMQKGDLAPEPALPIVATTKEGGTVRGEMLLRAEHDGAGWRFTRLNDPKQDAAPGETLENLRLQYAKYQLVAAGSKADEDFAARERKFLSGLSQMPKI